MRRPVTLLALALLLATLGPLVYLWQRLRGRPVRLLSRRPTLAEQYGADPHAHDWRAA